MVQSLLLCFVHGFKGSHSSFYDFPEHLKALIKETTPDLDVHCRVFPKFETRGDLALSVAAFRTWLEEQVLELESAKGNEAPRINPETGVVILAHSMGGMVAADAFFSILDGHEQGADSEKMLFPLIQGILAFDTPYCGLSRSMFAYGAFAQYRNVSNAYTMATSLSALARGKGMPQPEAADGSAEDRPAWKLYQFLALRTGYAGFIAAAGAACYMNREKIGEGLSYVNKESISSGLSTLRLENIKELLSSVSRENIEQGFAYMSRENLGNGLAWLSGHLQFVSALMKSDELRDRIQRLSSMEGIGFVNLYTSLGKNDLWSGGYFVAERTFCSIPTSNAKIDRHFIKEVNPKAKDETAAHMTMFQPPKNPGYEEMAQRAKGLVLNWATNNTGLVVDRHTIAKKNEASRGRNITRYTWSPDSGLKEVSQTKGNWPTWQYNGLASYVPNIKSAWPTKQKDTGPKQRINRYYYSEEAGTFREASEAKPRVEPPADRAAQDPTPESIPLPDDTGDEAWDEASRPATDVPQVTVTPHDDGAQPEPEQEAQGRELDGSRLSGEDAVQIAADDAGAGGGGLSGYDAEVEDYVWDEGISMDMDMEMDADANADGGSDGEGEGVDMDAQSLPGVTEMLALGD